MGQYGESEKGSKRENEEKEREREKENYPHRPPWNRSDGVPR